MSRVARACDAMSLMSHTGTLLRLSDREVLLDQRVVMRGDRIVAELTPLEAQLLA